MKRLRGPPSPPLRDAPENARDGGSGSAADETKGGSSERSSHTGGGGNSAAIEPDSLLSEDERDENVGGGDPPSLGRQVACLRACGRPWSAEEGKRFRDALPLDLLQRMVTEYLRTPAAERFRELAPSLPPSDGGGDDGGELRARKFESDVRSRSERWVRSMCVTAADVRQWERRARESECLSEYPPTSPVHGAPDDERETNDDDNSGAKLYERAGVRFREMRRVMRLCETTLGSTHVERTGSALDSLPKVPRVLLALCLVQYLSHFMGWVVFTHTHTRTHVGGACAPIVVVRRLDGHARAHFARPVGCGATEPQYRQRRCSDRVPAPSGDISDERPLSDAGSARQRAPDQV